MTEQKSRLIQSSLAKEDLTFEAPLRPSAFEEFIGQNEVKERLKVMIEAASLRKEPLGHCLLSGPPGLGKTTLANIIAKLMKSSIIITSGPVLEKPSDLVGMLTSLQNGDVLFIDEIHRLPRAVEEYLYPAIEDFKLDLMIDSGPHARSVQVKLNRFTLIGATTRFGLLSSPLRSRFHFTTRLDYYPAKDLERILKRSSQLLKLKIDDESFEEIALRGRGTPRIANNLLRFVRDYAQVRSNNVISRSVAKAALDMLAIDGKGLDEMDKRVLTTLIDHYEGGPVGLNTLSLAVGEESHTIEEVHEPFLILQGFLKRTSRGRVATPLAYEHLKKTIMNRTEG